MAIKTKWVTEEAYYSEDQLARAIFQWFDKEYSQYRGLYVLNFNNPANARQGNMLLGQGLRAGHPDATLFLPIFRLKVAGLHLEYKLSKTGVISPKQLKQHKLLKAAGYHVEIITSLAQFQSVINNYITQYKIKVWKD